MSTLIIGNKGSMGIRYQAILNHLRKPFVGIDKGGPIPAEDFDSFIIATPTETHASIIQMLSPYKKPILCEKPVSKNIGEVTEILHQVSADKTPFKMMLQYEVLSANTTTGLSLYNYFRHGRDGLAWDCIQIIGLARGEVSLSEESPIWQCWINGKELSLSHMDYAYVKYVDDWFKQPHQDKSQILDIHVKTDEAARSGRYG